MNTLFLNKHRNVVGFLYLIWCSVSVQKASVLNKHKNYSTVLYSVHCTRTAEYTYIQHSLFFISVRPFLKDLGDGDGVAERRYSVHVYYRLDQIYTLYGARAR